MISVCWKDASSGETVDHTAVEEDATSTHLVVEGRGEEEDGGRRRRGRCVGGGGWRGRGQRRGVKERGRSRIKYHRRKGERKIGGGGRSQGATVLHTVWPHGMRRMRGMLLVRCILKFKPQKPPANYLMT